jgi:hypothetical protein
MFFALALLLLPAWCFAGGPFDTEFEETKDDLKNARLSSTQELRSPAVALQPGHEVEAMRAA